MSANAEIIDKPSTATVEQAAISETLRIPLAARALGDSLFPRVAVNDLNARQALARLGDDGSTWLADRQSVFGVLKRTCLFKELSARYLQRRPAGLVANLGCGLSDYSQWLDNGQANFLDADLPDVMVQRRALLGEAGERQRLSDLDLCEKGWWDRLGLPESRNADPVFLFSEGVLMYLQPGVVRAVLQEFGERAPAGSTFAFDAICWLIAGRAHQHRSVKHTKAQFGWGPRRLQDIHGAHSRLQKPVVHRVMEEYGLPYNLMGPIFQAIFGVSFYGVYELKVDGD
ncbi:class I SAM-dependent methyltransferase [Pseudomonas sp. PA27(2017)]|uniref:class I SAM-dependent methyltransferase n=1 Tax=Pseudomonas sp. PA27(2017) TaxID=1932112 RepID=UPI000969E64E|nr:class I SAM-dependent methyltransferase [Pseudomonas sp. PA27(2017)]OLU33788.1 poly(3-hydroxyalkanoate) synthetase [Pseudomonas sp. PA27(2017)]